MKKRSCAALLLASLTVLILAGCAPAEAAKALDFAEDRVERRMEALEENVERAVEEAIRPAPAPRAAYVPEDFEGLRPEEAQSIALEHAGFFADEVHRLRTEFETDDRIPHYDVQFSRDYREYEYEIHAESGEILSFEMDD